MMFADDVVLCSRSRKKPILSWEMERCSGEEGYETEHFCFSSNGKDTIRLQSVEVAETDEFRYLRLTLQRTGDCGREVKKRVQGGLNGKIRVTGVTCDKKTRR
ncbi:uncharacterized protein LOC119576436 [Penaeus monodon]|uniref:uncharacterized protein LOC119576436 n=1 Tax=Penaeus monodon TaxID=6687 RepID=UPI0018A7A8AA|nr:uncharacterized protein LOC119576436 [Penaeus monodon]